MVASPRAAVVHEWLTVPGGSEAVTMRILGVLGLQPRVDLPTRRSVQRAAALVERAVDRGVARARVVRVRVVVGGELQSANDVLEVRALSLEGCWPTN